MKTLIKEETPRPRTRTAPRKVARTRPAVASAPRRSTPTRARRRPANSWVWAPVVMAIVLGFAAYQTSTLMAQTRLEAARREGLRSSESQRQVRLEVARLREEVARLSSMRSVDQWALARGFESLAPVESLGEESMRVAFNR